MNGVLNGNIKNFRIFRGLTQEGLAERIGKSKNVISNWERGDNSPDIDSVEKICKELSVTPNQIFGWEPCREYERYTVLMQEKKNTLRALEAKRNALQRSIDQLLLEIKEEEMKRNE